MDVIVIFLGGIVLFIGALAVGFAFGYQVGYASFSYENLKKSLSDFKKNTFRTLLPREKVVILNSKEAYLPDPEDDIIEDRM